MKKITNNLTTVITLLVWFIIGATIFYHDPIVGVIILTPLFFTLALSVKTPFNMDGSWNGW